MLPKAVQVDGVPSFAAPIGTRVVDRTNKLAYMNMDGTGGGWEVITKAAAPATHNNTWADVIVNTPRQQFGVCAPSNNISDGEGWFLYQNLGGDTRVKGIDIDGPFFGTTGNNGLICPSSTPLPHSRQVNPYLNLKFKETRTTDVRMFIGLTDQTSGTMVGSDDPAGNYAGVQFSTNRADTNWQFVTKDGATQTVVDTGVPISTDLLECQIEIDESGPTVVVRLLDKSGAELASNSFAANLMAAATAMRIASGAASVSAAADPEVRHYWYFGCNQFNKTP